MRNTPTGPAPASFANSVDSPVCSTIFTTHQEPIFNEQHFPKVELIQISKPMTDYFKEISISSNKASFSSYNYGEIDLKLKKHLSMEPQSVYSLEKKNRILDDEIESISSKNLFKQIILPSIMSKKVKYKDINLLILLSKKERGTRKKKYEN